MFIHASFSSSGVSVQMLVSVHKTRAMPLNDPIISFWCFVMQETHNLGHAILIRPIGLRVHFSSTNSVCTVGTFVFLACGICHQGLVLFPMRHVVVVNKSRRTSSLKLETATALVRHSWCSHFWVFQCCRCHCGFESACSFFW